MSSVVISGDTSGAITLSAPAVAGTNTITLPASTGTVALTSQINGPAFSAYLPSSQTVTASTWTKIQYSTEEFDTNSNYDTTNYRFTPTVAGYYQVSMGVYFNGGGYAALNMVAIYKNGSNYKSTRIGASSGVLDTALTISCIVYCNGSTDYIEAYGYNGISASPSFGTSPYSAVIYFQAAMIRSA